MARGSRAAERSGDAGHGSAGVGGENVPGDRSVSAQLHAGGLRALLKEAAQVRKSTLAYFEANPNECSPEARRRASQALTGSRPSEAAPLRLGGRNADEPPPGEEEEASQVTPVDVVATGLGGLTVSPQTSERGGAEEPQGSDAELRKQLRESQAEVRRLQGALDCEQDTTRRLAAELRNAEEACDSLRSKLSDLDAQLAQAKEALELQESAVADAEAFAEELEEMQELLADSERQNTDLQKRISLVDDPEGFAAELEEMQELLADSERQNKELQKKLKALPDAAAIAKELEEMRGKLAASERENTEVLKKLSAVPDADSFAEELEEMREKLAASERQNTELQEEADALQREYDAIIEQLRGELAESEAAKEKVQADCDKALSDLRDKLEHTKGKPEVPEEVVSRELTPVDRARARKKERENAAALEKELQDLRAQVSELAEENERLTTASAASPAADLETDADPPSTSRAIKAPVAADSVLVDAEILASMCTRAGSGASLCKLFLDGWRIVMAREEALRRDATMAALLESRGRRMCLAASLRRWVSAVSRAVRDNPSNATVGRSMSHEQRREAGTAGDRDILQGDSGSDGGVGEDVGGYVSEGVQTMSVEGRAQGAQTVPAAGSGIHTQTAPPEPGVVVETQTTTATNASTTQTTATATATTATGTGDEDGGMDVQVASGPAPAPRELAMALSDDASSATTSLDAAGPGSEHYDAGCGTSDSVDMRELEEHLREGCELVESLEWNEWLQKLERGGKETVAAAAAARQLEQTLPLLLRSVGLLTRESGEMASSSSSAQSDSSRGVCRELEEARAMVAAAVADRDRAQRRQEEMDDGIGASVGEMEKQLREAEKQLEELEEEVMVLTRRLMDKDAELLEREQRLKAMEEKMHVRKELEESHATDAAPVVGASPNAPGIKPGALVDNKGGGLTKVLFKVNHPPSRPQVDDVEVTMHLLGSLKPLGAWEEVRAKTMKRCREGGWEATCYLATHEDFKYQYFLKDYDGQSVWRSSAERQQTVANVEGSKTLEIIDFITKHEEETGNLHNQPAASASNPFEGAGDVGVSAARGVPLEGATGSGGGDLLLDLFGDSGAQESKQREKKDDLFLDLFGDSGAGESKYQDTKMSVNASVNASGDDLLDIFGESATSSHGGMHSGAGAGQNGVGDGGALDLLDIFGENAAGGASGGVQQASASKVAALPDSVQLTMTLGMSFHKTGEEGSSKREAFKRDVANDLAKASGLPAENFKITKLSAGSVIVDIDILPDPLGFAPAPSAVARDLEQQAADPKSPLRSGKLTSQTKGIQVLSPPPSDTPRPPVSNPFAVNPFGEDTPLVDAEPVESARFNILHPAPPASRGATASDRSEREKELESKLTELKRQLKEIQGRLELEKKHHEGEKCELERQLKDLRERHETDTRERSELEQELRQVRESHKVEDTERAQQKESGGGGVKGSEGEEEEEEDEWEAEERRMEENARRAKEIAERETRTVSSVEPAKMLKPLATWMTASNVTCEQGGGAERGDAARGSDSDSDSGGEEKKVARGRDSGSAETKAVEREAVREIERGQKDAELCALQAHAHAVEERLAAVESAHENERNQREREHESEISALEEELRELRESRDADSEERDKTKRERERVQEREGGQAEEMRALKTQLASVQAQLAAALEELTVRGKELDELSSAHIADLEKARAAIDAAQTAAQHVKGVGSEALVAELVALHAELRQCKLALGKEGEEDGGDGGEEDTVDTSTVSTVSSSINGRRRISGAGSGALDLSRERAEEVQQQLNGLLLKCTEEQAETQQLLAMQGEAQEREDAMHRQCRALETERDALQKEGGALREQLRALQLELEALQKVDDILPAQREKGSQEGSKEVAALKAEIEKLKDDAQKKQAERDAEKQAAAAELDKSTQSAALLRTEHDALQKEGDALREQLRALQLELMGNSSASTPAASKPVHDTGVSGVPRARASMGGAHAQADESAGGGGKRSQSGDWKGMEGAGDDSEHVGDLEKARAGIDAAEAASVLLQKQLERAKKRGDELSKQNSEIAHKLQIALRKKAEAEAESSKALHEAARHAATAAGAQCEARGLRAEIELMREKYESFRRSSNSFDQIFMSPIGGPLGGGVLADGAGGQRSLDVREAKKALSRGDPEELEEYLRKAISEVEAWRRGTGGEKGNEQMHLLLVKEASIASETANIRAEVLEIEVDTLTKEVVAGRAGKAAAEHYLRGLLEDLSRCAAEAGEVHAALCIGLDAVVNDSEENTYEVMQQHKTLLNKLVQETQARHAAEEALNAHLKGQGRSFGRLPRSSSQDEEMQKLRKDLKDTKAKYQALQEESRLYSEQHEANRSSIAVLSEMLEETRIELEKYKSSKIHGRLEQRRALLRQLTLDSGEASPESPQSPQPYTTPVKPEPAAVNRAKKGRGPAD